MFYLKNGKKKLFIEEDNVFTQYYRSQQGTRSGSMYFYHKGCELVEKHLDIWPRVRPDGFSFCAWIPERPRYMHQTIYRRYLRRFAKYQDQHQRRQLLDMARLLRLFK